MTNPGGASICQYARPPAGTFEPPPKTSIPFALPLGVVGHWYGVLTPPFEAPEWATPRVPPVEPPPGVQLPHRWIQMIPAAPASATNLSIAPSTPSPMIGARTRPTR